VTLAQPWVRTTECGHVAVRQGLRGAQVAVGAVSSAIASRVQCDKTLSWRGHG